jgi:hypothetical protein
MKSRTYFQLLPPNRLCLTQHPWLGQLFLRRRLHC